MAKTPSIYEDKLHDLETENKDLRKQRESDKDTIEDIQVELQNTKIASKDKDAAIAKAKDELEQAKKQYGDTKKEHERIIHDLNKQHEQLQADYDKRENDVEYHKDRAAHSESMLSRAYAEQENLREAYNAELKVKHDIEAQKLDLQLRYDALLAQWQDDQEEIEELKSRDDLVEAFEDSQRDMERDLAGQQAMIAEHERSIIVKDERIAHLEAQYQRERQRNLDAADAAAEATVAAATSHDNEAPLSLGGHGESLADELSEQYNEFDGPAYEHYYESQDSPKVFQGVDTVPSIPPILPLTIDDVSEYFSVAPLDVPAESLTTHIGDNTSTSPKAVPPPSLTAHVHKNTSTAPVAPTVQDLTTELQVASLETAPVTPTVQDLTTELQVASLETAPVTPTVQDLTTELQVASLETAPVVPTVPDLTTELHAASLEIAPIAPTVPDLITELHAASLSTAPIAPTAQNLTTDFIQPSALEYSPIAVLTQKLSAEIIQPSALEYSPIAPLTQKLSAEIIQPSALEYSPIAVLTENLSAEIIQPSALEYSPIAPLTQKLSAEIIQPSALEYSPTAPARAATVSTNNTFAPVSVTHDQVPSEARPIEIATTSAGVQTTETPAQRVETRIVEVIKPQKIGLLQAILPAVAALLTFLCLWQYAQLQAWETANDYSYVSSYDRSGAYGNGRYVFGIPAAMDIGGNWYTEQFAKFMSMMITRVESWAGIEYVPAY